MKQICIILSIVIFTLVTFYILEAGDTKNIKRVYIQSQTMALSQESTGITKQGINFQNIQAVHTPQYQKNKQPNQ